MRTGVTHTTQQMISAGPRTEKMGYPAKRWPTTPEGFQLQRNQVEKGITTFQFPRSGGKKNGSKPMPANITLKQDCDSLQSHWPTK